MANQSASASDLLRQADVSKLPELARKLKLAGSWSCPTMVANARAHDDALWLGERELVPAAIVARYRRAYPDDQDPLTSPKAFSIYLASIAALHKSRVNLLLGTDAFKPGTLPGFSLHEELANFVAAGLTPYEALRAGTRDAARFLQRESEFGSVAIGYRADLLLLTANPLSDIRNVSKRAGVLVQGAWFPEAELQDKLRGLTPAFRP